MIKVMIAEDERLARDELEYLLKQESDLQLLPSAGDGKELLALVDEHHPDVIFMDVRMPEMEGTKAAALLSSKPGGGPLIVFCTAFEQFALEAFGLNAVDYLLKPYEVLRLKECLKRVRERYHSIHAQTSPAPGIDRIVVEEGENIIILEPKDIIFAEKDEKHLIIHTGKRKVKTRMSIQQFEDSFNKNQQFLKPHRSYLVNIDHINEIRPWMNGAYNIVLREDQDTRIPVSRTSIKTVLSVLNQK
ncbi:LytR/AlgR family response regulator transcription factor [Bacillus pinisoli]|uniref:LytR/AlgR family response regulator transcription factor n=1 Tax=Bacillus pinisoli TaxID=2901866 RepID=UPI001FF3CD4D|nr:LytTR family DNA-binding domain-containing protein [Bacillus pinisoli]